jgi:hypothetical protein
MTNYPLIVLIIFFINFLRCFISVAAREHLTRLEYKICSRGEWCDTGVRGDDVEEDRVYDDDEAVFLGCVLLSSNGRSPLPLFSLLFLGFLTGYLRSIHCAGSWIGSGRRLRAIWIFFSFSFSSILHVHLFNFSLLDNDLF